MFDDGPDPATRRASRLDDELRDLGRRQLAELRARHGWTRPARPGNEPVPAASGGDIEPPVDTAASMLDDPDRIAAQMAAGALREQLERRIADLEAENARLRTAFAAAMRALASGIGPASVAGSDSLAAGGEVAVGDDEPGPDMTGTVHRPGSGR